MCYFISLTLPRDVTSDEVFAAAPEAVHREIGSRFLPIDNQYLKKQLRTGEQLGIRNHSCDCGTPLGWRIRERVDDPEWRQKQPRRLEEELKRLKRKGWSESKIARWRQQKELHATADKKNVPTPSTAAWLSFLIEALNSGATARIGLLLHWYDDDLEHAKIDLRKVVYLSRSTLSDEVLSDIEPDILYEFS